MEFMYLVLITRTPGESYRSFCFVSRLSSADQLLSFLGKLICWFLPKNILTVTLGKLMTDGMKHNLGSFESMDTTLNATVSFFDRDVWSQPHRVTSERIIHSKYVCIGAKHVQATEPLVQCLCTSFGGDTS